MGLLFLFFYVANAKTELFLSLNDDSSFIFTWAIGYEVLTILAILLFIKNSIAFSMENRKESKRPKFRRP
jgi:cell division protein FtsX